MPSEKTVKRQHSCSRGWHPRRRGWGWRPSRGWTLASRGAGASPVEGDAAEAGVGSLAGSSGRIVWPPEARVVSNRKKAALDESPSDDRLPNRQINKPKKSVHVDFLPRKKAGKPVGFWATKLALNIACIKKIIYN
jgi:hypothetical protein